MVAMCRASGHIVGFSLDFALVVGDGDSGGGPVRFGELRVVAPESGLHVLFSPVCFQKSSS